MNWLEMIGGNVMAGLSNVGTAMLLLWQTIKQLKMLNAWHVLQQMAHLGVDSLPIISLTLLFAGGVMTLQITDVLITYGAPRVVACMIMVPILAFYGVVIGIAGGYFVATTIKGLAPATYLDSIQMFSTISDFTLGLIKSSVFGAVIALVGCYKGMHTKMGAEAVGFSTTSSVVTSIILVFVLNYFLSTLLF